MVETVEATDTLANFAADPRPYLARMRETSEVVTLTADGDEVVVLDAATYRRMAADLYRLEILRDIREGLEDAEAGRDVPARAFLRELSGKYKLPEVKPDAL